ncbi:MAG: AAA domain-containing protein [Acidimicrobiales bacterium]|nr:AAA domain-containing protein [Acidimicrobiales bacterium]
MFVRPDLTEHTELAEHVPSVDPNYHFVPEVERAILAGFEHNRRVLVQGLHGTGKSTHIEQVAARLGWPLLRINLDGHLTRMDLVGRDAIVLIDGQPTTTFVEGLLPWALQRPVAVVFDEYDAGRPDVMFVIQRLLERDGKFTLLDTNRVMTPHPQFRLFATANTVGLGDGSGLYRGTQVLNQAQVDRWNIVARLDYLEPEVEARVVMGQVPDFEHRPEAEIEMQQMVALAGLVRHGFAAGDLSTVMSPRTIISWAENLVTFGDIATAFRLSFANKCDPAELPILDEYYQRAFG